VRERGGLTATSRSRASSRGHALGTQTADNRQQLAPPHPLEEGDGHGRPADQGAWDRSEPRAALSASTGRGDTPWGRNGGSALQGPELEEIAAARSCSQEPRALRATVADPGWCSLRAGPPLRSTGSPPRADGLAHAVVGRGHLRPQDPPARLARRRRRVAEGAIDRTNASWTRRGRASSGKRPSSAPARRIASTNLAWSLPITGGEGGGTSYNPRCPLRPARTRSAEPRSGALRRRRPARPGPAPPGIGVYTRSLLGPWRSGGRNRRQRPEGRALRCVGMAHKPSRGRRDAHGRDRCLERSGHRSASLWQQVVLPPLTARRRRPPLVAAADPAAPLPVPAVATVHDLTALLSGHPGPRPWRRASPFLRPSIESARRIVPPLPFGGRATPPPPPERRQGAGGSPPGSTPVPLGYCRGHRGTRRELGAWGTSHAGIRARTCRACSTPGRPRGRRPEDAEAGPGRPLRLGDGTLPDRLRTLGRASSGRVERGTPVRLFQGAWAFVCPSLYGFGPRPPRPAPAGCRRSSPAPPACRSGRRRRPAGRRRGHGVARQCLAQPLNDPGLEAALRACAPQAAIAGSRAREMEEVFRQALG
jgi:hypothetical protein